MVCFFPFIAVRLSFSSLFTFFLCIYLAFFVQTYYHRKNKENSVSPFYYWKSKKKERKKISEKKKKKILVLLCIRLETKNNKTAFYQPSLPVVVVARKKTSHPPHLTFSRRPARYSCLCPTTTTINHHTLKGKFIKCSLYLYNNHSNAERAVHYCCRRHRRLCRHRRRQSLVCTYVRAT